MVLQLAHHVQTCLHQHNKPQLSFYDKMMANKRKEEERTLAAEQQKLRKEIEANKEREEDEVWRIKHAKPQPNNCNISMWHIATLFDASDSRHLTTLSWHVGSCWSVDHKHTWANITQYVMCHRWQQGGQNVQHVVERVAICCIEMLWLFGQGLEIFFTAVH